MLEKKFSHSLRNNEILKKKRGEKMRKMVNCEISAKTIAGKNYTFVAKFLFIFLLKGFDSSSLKIITNCSLLRLIDGTVIDCGLY